MVTPSVKIATLDISYEPPGAWYMMPHVPSPGRAAGFFRYLRKVVGSLMAKCPLLHVFITIAVSHTPRRLWEVET